MITYDHVVQVRLDGKLIGEIRHERDPQEATIYFGWRYYPKGKKVGGELFQTLDEVARSLEEV
jgi:hypothetical protein